MAIYNHMEEFDPSLFGLSDRYVGNGRGRSIPGSKSYVLLSHGGDDRMELGIVLSKNAGERTIELLGDTVNFDFDKNGAIYLWAGISRKISTNGKESPRYTISVGKMLDEYMRKMGEFRRLYVKPEYFGNHVKLTPTGERDEM